MKKKKLSQEKRDKKLKKRAKNEKNPRKREIPEKKGQNINQKDDFFFFFKERKSAKNAHKIEDFCLEK